MSLRRQDTKMIAFGTGGTLVLVGLVEWLGGPAVSVASGAVVVVLGVFVRSAYRELLAAHDSTRAQVQASVALQAILSPRQPLPAMTGWRAMPELAAEITSEILSHHPHRIVELGSGVSTLIAAYAMERAGIDDGLVISLDQDEGYAAATRRAIAAHDQAARAQVLYAPLIEYTLGGERWRWYDLARLPAQGIDLLIVDGPPHHTQPLARYPALPLLFDRLSEEAVIILDDAARASERAIVARWLDEYPGRFEHTYVATARGTSILRKTRAEARRLES